MCNEPLSLTMSPFDVFSYPAAAISPLPTPHNHSNRLYGRVLNLNRVGITSKGCGCYFDRSLKPGFEHSNRRKGGPGGGYVIPGHITLCVEDPIDPSNDTAKGSFNMRLVRQVRFCVMCCV